MQGLDEIINLLVKTPIMKGISAEHLFILTETSYLCEYAAGDTIFFQGADSNELYVVINGEVDIAVCLPEEDPESACDEVIVTTIRRGGSFGEIALIDSGPRSATARSGKSDTQLLVIPRINLLDTFALYPQLGYQIMTNLAADLARLVRRRTAELQIQESQHFYRI